jgi:hypothetical protein
MTAKSICRKLCFCLLFFLLYHTGHSQTLRGVVLDAKTGEPMIGATVMVKEAGQKQFVGTGKKQFVQLDGYFTFKNVTSGDYEVEISFANYKKHSEHVTVNKKTAELQ